MIKPKCEYDSSFSILYDMLLKQDGLINSINDVLNNNDGEEGSNDCCCENSALTLTLQEIKEIIENKNFVTEVIREIEKPVIVEKQIVKEIVVEKPIVTEKHVIVEKPIIIEKEVIREIEKPATNNSQCTCNNNTNSNTNTTNNNNKNNSCGCGCNNKNNNNKPTIKPVEPKPCNNNKKPLPTEYIEVKPNTTDEYIRSRVCKKILIKNPEYRFIKKTNTNNNKNKVIRYNNPHNSKENKLVVKHCG